MTTTPSDRILAEGAPLDLIDGRTVHVRYGMRGLKMLEDQFGSISEMQQAFTAVTSGGGKVIGPLVAFLACGLHAEGITEEHLLDLLDPAHFKDYGAVIGQAMAQAFPEADAPQDGLPNPQGPEPIGPGPSGTTSAPSSSAVLVGSSG